MDLRLLCTTCMYDAVESGIKGPGIIKTVLVQQSLFINQSSCKQFNMSSCQLFSMVLVHYILFV